MIRLLNAVSVYLCEGADAQIHVGTLYGSFQGGRQLAATSFEYDPTYLGRPEAYALSPDLPLQPGRVYTGSDTNMFGAFADATPDDWGTSLIDAQWANERGEGQPASLGAFDHLVQLNDDTRLGALRFTPVGEPDWLTVDGHTAARLVDAERLAVAAARFEQYEATEEDVELLGWAGSSLGGARPKATIADGDGLWLLKLPSNRDRRSDIEAWEAVALELADRAGLRVPRRRLIRSEDHGSSLLIARFDRKPRGGEAPAERIGYQSAHSAMQISSVQDRRTYEDFADTIDHLTGSRADLEEMFGRIALNVLIGNVDDHWRNHGFVRENGEWRLSPLFDVNPTRAGSRVQARQISASDDPFNRDIRMLVGSRDVYAVSASRAAEIVGRVADAVAQWREVAAEAGIATGEIESMAAAFSEAQLEHAREYVAAHAR